MSPPESLGLFGRKPKLTPQQRSDLLRRLAEGVETRAELARRYNVHPRFMRPIADGTDLA